MKTKTILILLFLSSVSHLDATFIKGKAKVYTIEQHIPFVVLYDSTYVLQTWNWQDKKIWVELYCYAKKRNLIKVANNHYELRDTVYLYEDKNFQRMIGYSWPATDSQTISFSDDFNNPNAGYLECWIYGHSDSASILEFEPWNNIIKKLSNNNRLFAISYGELNSLMNTIKRDCTPISGSGEEYSQVYNEENPTPGHALIGFFQNSWLKAVWIDANLEIKNKIKMKHGYLYYHDAVKSKVSKLKKDIQGYLNYTP